MVSPWWLRILGYTVDPQPEHEIGLPFIHGVEPNESKLYRPLQNFEGGTLIVGTTQSGNPLFIGAVIVPAIAPFPSNLRQMRNGLTTFMHCFDRIAIPGATGSGRGHHSPAAGRALAGQIHRA